MTTLDKLVAAARTDALDAAISACRDVGDYEAARMISTMRSVVAPPASAYGIDLDALDRIVARRPELADPAALTPSQPAAVGVTDEMVERAAQAVYEHWKFGKNDPELAGRDKPAWVHGGNSLRQDEARNYATAALEAALRSTP